MKGLILAGGTGSRLWPITLGVSKQLLPIYDKPLIHYPIATLMLAGIREIAIITTPEDHHSFIRLLGSGEQLGIKLEYLVQKSPDGLAQAFIIAEEFIGNEKVALILGDNIFYGAGLGNKLASYTDISGAHIFAYKVRDPERYGVVELSSTNEILSIEEKPSAPKSFYAIPGMYFYDNDVIKVAKEVRPSLRGELEISSINQSYLDSQRLSVSVLERGTVWLDTGTIESLTEASSYVKVIEERQGMKIGCLEEIAWRKGWINNDQLIELGNNYFNSPYGIYILNLLDKG